MHSALAKQRFGLNINYPCLCNCVYTCLPIRVRRHVRIASAWRNITQICASGRRPAWECQQTLRPSPSRALVRRWRNTVGNLIEFLWLKKAYHRPHFIDICVKHSGVRFHRTRDFNQHYFDSIPPTSQLGWGACGAARGAPQCHPTDQGCPLSGVDRVGDESKMEGRVASSGGCGRLSSSAIIQ